MCCGHKHDHVKDHKASDTQEWQSFPQVRVQMLTLCAEIKDKHILLYINSLSLLPYRDLLPKLASTPPPLAIYNKPISSVGCIKINALGFQATSGDSPSEKKAQVFCTVCPLFTISLPQSGVQDSKLCQVAAPSHKSTETIQMFLPHSKIVLLKGFLGSSFQWLSIPD